MNEGCLRIGFNSFFEGLRKELSFKLLLVSLFKGIIVADIEFMGGSNFVSKIWFIVDEKSWGGSRTSTGGLFSGVKGDSFGRRKSGGREKVGTLILSFVVSRS